MINSVLARVFYAAGLFYAASILFDGDSGLMLGTFAAITTLGDLR